VNSTGTQPTPGLGARIGWSLYDWASNSYAAIVSTFVFPAYFTQQVASDPTRATSLWGNTVGLAGLLVALAAPVLGAMADQSGRRKPWIAWFTGLCVLATASLWWLEPHSGAVTMALLLVGGATVAAEFAAVFYNAMLPSLAPPGRVGRWSGWAWGLGYIGGILSLLLAQFALVGEPAWLGLPRADYAHVRATFVLVAAWYAVFALPLFVLTPDEAHRSVSLRRAFVSGLAQLRDSLRAARAYAGLLRFLVARMLFIDGLATIFAFGGVYAAGTFGMDEQQVLWFGIALNVTAGIGAVSFGWVDDVLGSRRTILLSLGGLILCGSALLVVESLRAFWGFAMALGVFVGPVQAAGRSYLARAAPASLRTQMFGLLAFSGKATAFVGPFLVGWVTASFDSQRVGMSVIVVLLTLGFLLMLRVPESDAACGR
jgi:UMF1 family MFS transporter